MAAMSQTPWALTGTAAASSQASPTGFTLHVSVGVGLLPSDERQRGVAAQTLLLQKR
jgi:hypothetical protein